MSERFSMSIIISLLIHAVVFFFLFQIKIPEMASKERQNSIKMKFIALESSRSRLQLAVARHTENSRSITIDLPKKDEMVGLKRIAIPDIEKINREEFSARKSESSGDIIKGGIEKALIDLPEIALEPKLPNPEELSGSGDVLSKNERNSVISKEEGSIIESGQGKLNSSIIWKGESRDIEYSYPVKIPELLKKIGKNVDVKAEISVNPMGNVVIVRILKSSGFIEVDSVVEEALRRYKFSPSGKNNNEIGEVTFKFILEMED